MKDRLYKAIPVPPVGVQAPHFPFSQVNVNPEGVHPAVQQQPQQQPQHATVKKSLSHGHQSQAPGNFQTLTSASTHNQYVNGNVGDHNQMPGQYNTGQRQMYNPVNNTPQPPVPTMPVESVGPASKG